MRRRTTGLVAGLFLALVMSGCSSATATPDQGEPELPAALPVVNMSTFLLPLDAYRITDEQGLAAYNARGILIVRCLHRFGFTITPPPPLEHVGGGLNERRYFLVDETRAHTYGYKWPEITNQKRPPEPSIGPEEQAAMTGRGPSQVAGVPVPAGGCMGEAARLLGVDTSAQAGTALVQQLARSAFGQMQNDSRVLAATRRWSECMARSGYHYADPAGANGDPSFSTPVATPAEIATAVADVACKKETNLVNIEAAVETAYQKRAIEQHQQELKTYQDALNNEVRLAADIVAGRA